MTKAIVRTQLSACVFHCGFKKQHCLCLSAMFLGSLVRRAVCHDAANLLISAFSDRTNSLTTSVLLRASCSQYSSSIFCSVSERRTNKTLLFLRLVMVLTWILNGYTLLTISLAMKKGKTPVPPGAFSSSIHFTALVRGCLSYEYIKLVC